jgi:hypothetical protein
MADGTTPDSQDQSDRLARLRRGAIPADPNNPLLRRLGDPPGPDEGIGDAERARRIDAVLDQFDEARARREHQRRNSSAGA